MRLMDYPKKTDVTGGGQYFVTDSATDGTKAIEMNDIKKSAMNMVTSDEYYDFLDRIGIPWQQRRNIYRGKKLGTSVTDEQKARIADGTFKGFFIGDYWEMGSNYWRIADINYWISTGPNGCYSNHLVIVPDFTVGNNKPMNDTNVTNGGFRGCKWFSSYYQESFDIVSNLFDVSSLLYHDELFTNAVTNGAPSAGSWAEVAFSLMNEPMVFGSYMLTPATSFGTDVVYRHTIDKTQLALFGLHPSAISGFTNGVGRMHYWLRDICSEGQFVSINSAGFPFNTLASNQLGIRPIFAIKGS